jgi:membrane protease YdiL (CAAX protease family)
VIVAMACLVAGTATLAARLIADDVARIVYGVILAALYLGFALFAKTHASLERFWQLAFAFFVLAVVQVLNNALPGYIATDVLHAPPIAGNPLASTVSATVVVQLVGTLIAVVPVVGFTLLSGGDLSAVYARVGKRGWLIVALVFFIVIYLFIVTLPLRPDSPMHALLPSNTSLSMERILALTPALVVISIANGFEEEFLFRGLFLKKYELLFNARVANVLQAVIFGVAHAGVTYTPSALVFILLVVFPLGLLGGYLMRASNGVLTPAIAHGALDMAIYVGFLSYVF